MNDLQKQVVHTLRYFAFFQYAPTFEELHTFLSTKIKQDIVRKEIETLIRKNIIQKIQINSKSGYRYTVGEYIFPHKKFALKLKKSSEKMAKSTRFISILSRFPYIKLIGLSGSVAMMNAEKNDDIDLFIITTHNRMWTARFLSLMLSQIMGVRRKRRDIHVQDKICMNLFFDENNVKLPAQKRSEYGAHEVLQMKPLVNKGNTYQIFLEENQWVFKLFPNARKYITNTSISKNKKFFKIPFVSLINDGLEYILKYIQLSIINKHKTTEIISDTQLWFFPKDFEKKVQSITKK